MPLPVPFGRKEYNRFKEGKRKMKTVYDLDWVLCSSWRPRHKPCEPRPRLRFRKERLDWQVRGRGSRLGRCAVGISRQIVTFQTIQLPYQLLNENSKQIHHILLMIMASAPASEQVLNAFNEILNLTRAYTYDRQQASESLTAA